MSGFIKRYAPVIYGPTALVSLGEGAAIPVIPLFARELGANVSLAALITSALIIGRVLGNLPAGHIIARLGERITMVLAGLMALLGAATMGLTDSIVLFTIAVFWTGFMAAAFSIARHSFMTTNVPYRFRARSLSLLGGVYRLGIFIGPFAGSAIIALTGVQQQVFYFFVLCLALAVLLVWFGPDPEKEFKKLSPPGAESRPVSTETSPIGVIRTVKKYRSTLIKIGSAAASMSAVRQARHVILPLWGASIGLDTPTILLVVGVSGALDFGLFYISGQIMDRHGRIWAALPSMIIMGLGFLVLAFTHELSAANVWFWICALFVGVGNGLSSGILMTVGSDLAPKKDPAAFLGAWHTLNDGGSALTPVIFSGLVALSTISVATFVIGLFGIYGAYGFLRWMPRDAASR